MYTKGMCVFSVKDGQDAFVEAGPVDVLGVNYYWLLLLDETLSLAREDAIVADRISMREGEHPTRRVSEM